MDVSVIIPVFNKLPYLDRALSSVLKQSSASAREIIFVNDGSTDGSAEHLTMLAKQDRRITVVHKDNRGVSAARNTGIDVANAEFVAFLDADDEWHTTFLAEVEDLRDCMRDCDVFGTSYAVVSETGMVKSPHRDIRVERFTRIDRFFHALAIGSSPFCSSSVCVSRNAISAVGGFPDGLAYGEDVVTWAKLALLCRLAWSSRECVNVFAGTVNSSSLSWSPARAAQLLETFAKLTQAPVLRSPANSAGEFLAQDMRLALMKRREIAYGDALGAGYYGAALRHLAWLSVHQQPMRFFENSSRMPIAAAKALLKRRS